MDTRLAAYAVGIYVLDLLTADLLGVQMGFILVSGFVEGSMPDFNFWLESFIGNCGEICKNHGVIRR